MHSMKKLLVPYFLILVSNLFLQSCSTNKSGWYEKSARQTVIQAGFIKQSFHHFTLKAGDILSL